MGPCGELHGERGGATSSSARPTAREEGSTTTRGGQAADRDRDRDPEAAGGQALPGQEQDALPCDMDIDMAKVKVVRP